MTESALRHHVDGGAGVITLDRAGKHNALTQSMWADIPIAVNHLVEVDRVSSILIRGANQSFSAGADLSEVLVATSTPDAARDFCQTVVDALLAIARCPIPTVARLSGIASGGGAELALASDIRIADETASLQLPLSGLGVVPDEVTLSKLLATVGSPAARFMLLTGRAINARECLRIGLVQAVVPPADLDVEINALLNELTSKSKFAVKRIKAQVLEREMPDSSRQDLSTAMADSFFHGDVATNAQAFLDSRTHRRSQSDPSKKQENSH
jgi:enoyl-CoA hydratase/carnithine racemase